MPDAQSPSRRAATAAFLCSSLHVLAAAVMLFVLRPGLPPSPGRARYVADHPGAWGLGWGLWIVTTLSLALFYFSFHRAVGGGRAGRFALPAAVAGMVPDLGSQVLYVLRHVENERVNALLSGVLGNGAYTAAWAVLVWAARAALPRPLVLGAVPGVVEGAALTVTSAFVRAPGMVASAAAVIPLFTAWCFLVGLFFWKNRGSADTMSPRARP